MDTASHSPYGAAARQPVQPVQPAQPVAPLPEPPQQPARKSARPPAPQRFFRCHPLSATISTRQCRLNRGKLTAQEALLMPYDPLPWEMQPPPCAHCELALAVDARRVPLFTALDVLEGKAVAPHIGSQGPGPLI